MGIKVSLDLTDFNALVHGRVAVEPVRISSPDGDFGEVVEITLRDIGFFHMKKCIADAEEAQSAKEDSSSHPAGS